MGASLNYLQYTCTEFIAQNSKAPYVYFFIIEFSSHYLWRHVVQGSTESLSLTKIKYELLNRRVNSPSKIAHFQHSETIYNIFWFNIPMDDTI